VLVISAFRYPQVGVVWIIVFAALAAACFGQEEAVKTVAEIHQLSVTEARQGRNVRIQGVVTFTWHTGTTEFTLEDGTGAIWCPAITLPTDSRVGTEIEVEGKTDAGILGPFVHALAVRRIGPKPLPIARRSTFEELLSTQMNGRRVEITGIIRGQRMNPELGLDWLALEVATGGGRITVNVTHEAIGHPELIDATVRIRGVNLHATDTQQQAFLPMIYSHTLADIDIVTPANPAPFDQPPTLLAEVMRSANVAGTGHRARVRGIVTYVGAGNSFYLQDNSRGIQVFLRDNPRPAPGEAVEVAGFPEPGAFSPVLRDADWRPSDSRGTVSPQLVKIAEATRYDGRLIRVQGRLTEVSRAERETILTLEEDESRCRLHILEESESEWTPGSRLRVTGVCSVEIGDWETFVAHRKPIGFSLLVQNASAIELLQSAPWWNLARIAWLLAILTVALCCVIAALSWQSKLRLREAARTRDAAQAQFSAVLSERTRIAREIHDTLAQGLTGISAHLEVLNDRMPPASDKLRHHLGIARDLVRNSLEEARRSVWNLRSQALEESGLDEALRRLAHQLTDGSGIGFTMEVTGTSRTLPSGVENNLMRIGQEALTNVVRHARAKEVFLSLSYLPDQVCLAVSDNGVGFDSADNSSSQFGSFGLSGIRERADAMHASLSITENPAGGTRIELTVPHV
jgi:signal transduction histidine kinase